MAGFDYRPRASEPPVTPVTQEDPGQAAASLCYDGHTGGGTLQLFIANQSSQLLTISDVLLDGISLADLTNPSHQDQDPLTACTGGGVQWWRVDPGVVAPGGWSVISVNSDLLISGTQPSFTIKTSAGDLVANPDLVLGPERISDVAFDPENNGALVYLSPTGTRAGPVPVDGVTVNGSPVPWSGTKELSGSAPGLLRLDGHWDAGTQLVIGVSLGSSGTASAAVRVFPGRFVDAMMLGSDTTTADLDRLVADGFNTLRWGFPKFVDYARSHHLKLIGDYPSPDELTQYRGDPVVQSWYVLDEPDIPDPLTPVDTPSGVDPLSHNYQSPDLVEGIVAHDQQLDPTHPIEINDYTRGSLNEYASIPDVATWDDYPAQQGYMVHFESARAFSEAMQANASPDPFWFWSQAQPGGGRSLSPDESRAYNYMALGHGAKGLLWYTGAGPPSVFSQTNWPDMAYEARLWRVLGQDLALGHPWDDGATTTAPNIDLGTVVSPDAAVLTVANLDYDNLTSPTTFTERSGIAIDWQLPPWLKNTTLTLAEVSPNGVRPLGSVHGAAQITAQLTSTDLYVAAPASEIDKLASSLAN